MIKKLLAILLLFPTVSWGAPDATGVSGTISDGQSITITGSGFGSTGPTVQFFDNFESGSNGARIEGIGDTPTVGSWRDVSGIGLSNYPSYSTNFYKSGSKAFRINFNEADDCGSTNVWSAPNLSASSSFYVSFWMYVPAGQVIPGQTSCGPSPNMKTWWLSTNDVFQNDYSTQIISDSPTEIDALCWVDGSQDRACGGWVSWTLNKGRWMRFENYLQGSTSSGAIQAWYTDSGTSRYQTVNQTGKTLDNGTTGWGYLHFPGFGRKDSNSNIYYDDIYVATGAGARARVEIGNASTYSSCTNLAVITPTSWSDTSITATVRQGSFANGSAYLYVTDASGVTETNGLPITLGASSSVSLGSVLLGR